MAFCRSPSDGKVVTGRWINPLVGKKNLHDLNMAFCRSPSDGSVVIGRWINPLVGKKNLHDLNMAVCRLSSAVGSNTSIDRIKAASLSLPLLQSSQKSRSPLFCSLPISAEDNKNKRRCQSPTLDILAMFEGFQ